METWGLLASIAISFAASLIFAYLLYWFDRYEKEPFLLLCGVFLWGAFVAAGGAFLINTLLGLSVYVVTGSEIATDLTSSALIAPLIEEILKGFAVLLVFIIFYHEFDSILDGIVYAGVTALGFAASENAFYIFAYGYLEEGWQGFHQLAFIRLILVGWQHPFYTAFFGIGLAVARLNRNTAVRLTAPVIGLIAAMTAHAIHNILASVFTNMSGMVFTTVLDWLGWFMMLVFILVVTRFERRDLEKYLFEEIKIGTLTNAQYQIAVSAYKVSSSRIRSLFQGTYRTTTRLYKDAAELALKKKQLERMGEERGNQEAVEELRRKVSSLSKTLLSAS